MKRRLFFFLIGLIVLLTGCASTIESDVTVFHEWPATLQEKTYVFERTGEQENNLEYRSYENLVRKELQRLEFAETKNIATAALKVSMQYNMHSRDVRVVEPVSVDPFWYGPPFYNSFYSPFYNPFWNSAPFIEYRETSYRLFSRQLKIHIARISDSKNLYDVTVNSQGRKDSLAAVMPYMVQGAFADFPGKNGTTHHLEMKIKDGD